MLAVVMEGASHLKRPWDNENGHRSPDARSVMHRMTDSGGPRSNPYQLHKMPSPSHMLPPIVTAAEQPSRHAQSDRLPSASALPGSHHRGANGHSSQDASSKRPRLSYDESYRPDSGRGPPSAHGIHAKTPPITHDPRDQQRWSMRESQDSPSCNSLRDSCHICADSKYLVEKVVSGLQTLEAELRQVLASTPLSRTPKEVNPSTWVLSTSLTYSQEINEPSMLPNVAEVGLKDSLMWASSSVQSSTRLVRELAANQRALPRITVANLGMPPAHEPPSAITSAPPDFARSFMDKHERDRPRDGSRRYVHPYQAEYQLRPPESAQPPPSPHPTASSGSPYQSSQSPMGLGPSSRMLPSPSSLHTAPSIVSVQANYSPSSQSAHNTHLQDLQHQISTKSLALTTLQREHDQLLAAYSRMQIRCQTLDKKSQVSDHEINTLTEEKIRLQSQVEAFETQVEELVKARDEAQKQTTANGAQYMRIMAMSSKLQAQGSEEAKQYKSDREAWDRDREGLQKRIEDLEAGQSNPSASGEDKADVKVVRDPQDILSSASLDVLRDEVVRLRQSLLNMERRFQDLQQETNKMDHVIEECTGIRERLGAKTLLEEQVPTVAKSPAAEEHARAASAAPAPEETDQGSPKDGANI
jgi:hypothetical protein